MGNSSSIYNDLHEELQQEIKDLYKTVHCRYDYLKGLENKTDDQIREQLELDTQFMSQIYGAMHNGKRLKDILPDNVRQELDSECSEFNKHMKVPKLIEKRNEIATKIKEFMYSKEAKIGNVATLPTVRSPGDDIDDNQLGGSKKHRSKKHRTKKHRSKKHRSKKHRRH